MGQIEINHTGSGGGIVLSSDGTDLLLGGSAVGGGGGASAYTIENKTSAYTIVAGDLGKIINVTANDVTLTLTAAATLGAGWFCYIRNSSATSGDTVTIDGNGSETIEGGTTYALYRDMGVQLVCDGSNFFLVYTGNSGLVSNVLTTDNSSYFQPVASGDQSIAFGQRAEASGYRSFSAGGYYARAEASESVAIGGSSARASGSNSLGMMSSSHASGSNSIAIGYNVRANSAESVGIGASAKSYGTAAVALGNSYASGTDSFAAAIDNNTSSYGATGTNAIAIGDRTKTTGSYGISLGRLNIVSGTNGAAAIGQTITVSGEGSFAAGNNVQCNSSHAQAFGQGASTSGIFGKFARACGFFGNYGDRQSGWYSLVSDTTNATPEALTTNNNSPAANNQIVAASDTCIMFSGTVVAMQNGAADQGGWEIKGLLKNDGGTTTLVNSQVNSFDTGNGWDISLYADDTNNALKVQCTGEASHNIRWVANIQTSEVTYA